MFDELEGFDPAFTVTEDVEFSVRLARAGTLAYEPEPVAAIRVHAGNSPIELMFREHVDLTTKLVGVCDGPGEGPLRARLLADRARASWSLGDLRTSRRSGLAAVRQDLSVLLENGVAKRLAGSMLPAPVTSRSRELVRRLRGG